MPDRPFKFGDTVKAKPNSTADIWAEGRIGKIVETKCRDNREGNYRAQNLVKWKGDNIFLGFHDEDLTLVEERKCQK